MEIIKTDYLGHIPEPPIVRCMPNEGLKYLEELTADKAPQGVSHREVYIGCRDGNLCEITNPVFDGVNSSNLKDTSKVRIKSFTWNGWVKHEATQDEVHRANEDYPEDILQLYKFHAKYDPNIYNKSIGILSAEEKLQRILKTFHLDLGEVQETVIDLSMIWGGLESDNFIKEVLDQLNLPNVFVLNNILALIKEVQEKQDEMYKATYTGESLKLGFSQLSEATNNVALATFEQADATLMSGMMIAGALQEMAVESFRANKIARGWGGSLGLAHMANAQG